MEPNRGEKDAEKSSQSQPGIPRPGQQSDQAQDPNAPPQPCSRGESRSSQWIPPTTGNPDLDPPGLETYTRRIDLRERDPLSPQGMLFDPRQLLDQQRQGRADLSVPPGARFDPFGPPDPDLIGPGRGPLPSSRFGEPDPDHLPPPGVPQLNPRQGGFKQPGGKNLPWPPPGPRGPFG